MKTFPKIGDKLYLSQQTGNCWVDMVRMPYTVIAVSNSAVTIQACKLVFNGPRYYDTLADEILEDKNGDTLVLHWATKKERWQVDKYHTGYPSIAHFGYWDFQPYLD